MASAAGAEKGKCGLSREVLDRKNWVDQKQRCMAVYSAAGAVCGDPYAMHHSDGSGTCICIAVCVRSILIWFGCDVM